MVPTSKHNSSRTPEFVKQASPDTNLFFCTFKKRVTIALFNETDPYELANGIDAYKRGE